MRKYRKSLCIISALCLSTIFLSRCINKSGAFDDPRGRAFAGSATCRQCHQAIYDTFLRGAHFNASAEASKQNIRGNYHPGHNEFIYNKTTKVLVEARDSGIFQVLYINDIEKKAYRLDITFGTKNAQTWLYWQGDKTYELPVSYYTSVHDWGTSPGFSSTQPNFSRFIGTDCFECHSSNMKNQLNASTDGITESLVKESLVYGIDCERCHGPAASHVNYQQENPSLKTSKFITSAGSLTRQQKMDICAVCHSGNEKVKLESRFRFRPGDTLTNFLADRMDDIQSNDFDVHGNQYKLLSQSKCYLSSTIMTCGTCHDPHKNADAGIAFYSQKCMSCHREATHNFCPMATSLGPAIKNNCIDCHMPRQPSKAISFQRSGDPELSAYQLRNHRIAVYLAEQNKKPAGETHRNK
jgi:hypothetical protein